MNTVYEDAIILLLFNIEFQLSNNPNFIMFRTNKFNVSSLAMKLASFMNQVVGNISPDSHP